MNESFSTHAPARIHFGLFSIAPENGMCFGGAGMMVKAPETSVHCSGAGKLQCVGDSELVRKYVGQWWQHNHEFIPGIESIDELPIRIHIAKQPVRHTGFGSGTQIAMSVAVALYRYFDLAIPGAATLACVMNRGKRSAIGTYGFEQGGFIVDRGIENEDKISELELQISMPAHWRVVLFIPKKIQGVHGDLENKTFNQIVLSKTNLRREQLTHLCYDAIAPAVQQKCLSELGRPLHEFNRLSGMYFSDYQFGCYHSAICAQIVETVQQAGIDAVGQSSWGPAIFAITEDQQHAKDTVERLRKRHSQLYAQSNIDILITEPDNTGVRFETNR